MKELCLSLLGPFQTTLDGQPVEDFRTRKVQALLIYLAVDAQGHSRDALLELLWPGLPQKSARSNLRQILYYLRRDLPDVSGKDGNDVSVVVANRQEIRFNPRAAVSVDTSQFEMLLDGVDAHDHLDLFLCRDCSKQLEEAVALYRGDFLPNFYLDDSNKFEEWAHSRREYFRRRVLDALSMLVTMALRARDFSAAQAYAEKQLEIDNLRESAYRQLMEVLARSGRREQAAAVYESCRRVLAEELGMAPAARTTATYEKILRGDLNFDRATRQAVRGYELKEEIGEGAYGVIYRAVQPAILRQVAVKVIHRKYADNAEFIRRFEAEAQTVARLEHPYIVPLYDYWRDPQGAYLVMRYMRGGSLLEQLKEGPLDAQRAATMVDQVAAALAIAHQQGVIHRDIKPGNILLDEAGNAYVADFGIAKDLTEERRLTVDGAVVGSLDYISPEQITGDPVTPQTDIYSLGAVLYETLTGERPFGDTPVAQLLYKQVHESIPLVTATRPDVPAGVDAVIQKATAKAPQDRYGSVLEMGATFGNAVRGAQPEVEEQTFVPSLQALYNPYKGLQAFQEADAEDFFGRDALIRQLLDRLGATAQGPESRFLALVGPSGSGKSSVVKAGLVPALRQGALPGSDKWFIAEMAPGSNPLQELAQALWHVAVDPPPNLAEAMQRDADGILRAIRRVLPGERALQDGAPQLLLIIDQFEELFTLVQDEERRAFFLDSLLAALEAARSPLRLLVSLRADFYDRPLQIQEWGNLLKQNTEVVLPLNRSELTWAVREPARRVGVRLEEGLAPTIVADVTDQPGALPLLQYAMTELFERREGRRLTRSRYEELGGVRGALARQAENLYRDLDVAEQEVARQVFLRLITLGEGVEDTRRRVLRQELEALSGADSGAGDNQSRISEIIGRFGAARFLTFDRDPLTRGPTVEVAHEALLREWPRLRGWLAESRDHVRQQRMLAQATREWQAAGRDAGFLLRDARLDQFAGWAEHTPLALTDVEQDYLAASVAARQERLTLEEERRQRELQAARDLAAEQQKRAEEQARSAQALRRRAIYLAAALLVTIVLAVAAATFARSASQNAQAALQEADTRATAETIAEREREIAEQQASLATSRELSLAALNTLGSDPELSILLALQALETAQTKQAEEALHQALQASRLQQTIIAGEEPLRSLVVDPGGQWLATNDRNSIRVWDQSTGEELLTLPSTSILLYGGEGSRLALISEDEGLQNLTIQGWEIPSGATLISHTLPITTDLWSFPAISPDWSYLAVGYQDGTAALWDVATAEKLATFPAIDGWASTVLFSDDGARLLLGSWNGATAEVVIWDVALVASGAVVEPEFAFVGGGPFAAPAALSPDRSLLALGASAKGNGTIELWDLSTPGEAQLRLTVSGGQASIIENLNFSRDGSLLAANSYDGTVAVWEMTEGTLLYKLAGHDGEVHGAVFNPDGQTLATVGADGTARIWDAAPVAGGEVAHFAVNHRKWDMELSPDGQILALGGGAFVAGEPGLLFDVATGEQLLEMPGDPGTTVYRVAFHPHGHMVATVGEDNVIRLWDVASGDLLRAWTGHGEGETGGLWFGTIDVVFSPDGSRLATAGTDGVAKVWDIASGEELMVLSGHTDGLTGIAYSPDGRRIATASDQLDTTVKVWDATSGAEVYSVDGGPVRTWGLAFSPDSSLLATGSSEGTVKLWDLTTGELRYMLPSQVNTVTTILFTPDGSKLVTNGEALRVWDVASGTELVTVAEGYRFFDISPDGRFLYASEATNSAVQVFVLSLEDLVALAHERLTRWWTPEECQQYLHQEACPEKKY